MAMTGVTDNGVITASTIANAAAIALATANVIAATDIAEKQIDIAQKYLQIAQEENQYYYDVYVPCENEEVEEACSAQPYVEHDDIQIGRYKNSANQLLVNRVEDELACTSRYCTGRKAALIKDAMAAQAGAESSSANLGRRYEEHYADAMDDRRWARRAGALARGRDMMSRSVEFSGLAYGLFGRLGEQAAAGASGAIGYLGYVSNRATITADRPQRQQITGISYPLPQPQIQEQPMPENMTTPVTRPKRIMG